MKTIVETLKHALNESEDNDITFEYIIELAVGKKLSDTDFEKAFLQKQENWFSPEFDNNADAITFINKHKDDIVEDGESEYDNFDDCYWNDFVIDNIKCSIETKEELFKNF